MILLCTIDDGGDGSLPVVDIDDQEFLWDESGKMLCTYAGGGMRLIFVPDDELLSRNNLRRAPFLAACLC